MPEENRLRCLNRDAIKYIAMFTMLLNHIAHVFLDPGTVLCAVFTGAGYFTAPVMVYFMVEGYGYTRSKKKYFLRLLLFAALSQFPYSFALGSFGMDNLNMIVTLCLCFGIIWVTKTVENRVLRVGAVALLVFASLFCDWALLAPLYTLLFLWAEGDRKKVAIAYAGATALFEIFPLMGGLMGVMTGLELVRELLLASGVAAAGVCIVCFYNGRRMERGRTFSKWFFYLFYPAHLLALGVLARL